MGCKSRTCPETSSVVALAMIAETSAEDRVRRSVPLPLTWPYSGSTESTNARCFAKPNNASMNCGVGGAECSPAVVVAKVSTAQLQRHRFRASLSRVWAPCSRAPAAQRLVEDRKRCPAAAITN